LDGGGEDLAGLLLAEGDFAGLPGWVTVDAQAVEVSFHTLVEAC
jgi:hypothetical protein